MTRIVLTLAAVGAALQTPRRTLGAQEPAVSCEQAAKVVERGRPSQEDYRSFRVARTCGSVGGRAVATGLAKYAAESDVRALDDFMREVDDWRDAAVLDAATRLATTGSASPQARVFAVRHLLQLLQPNYVYTYDGLAKGADSTKTAELTVYTSACRAQITPRPEKPAVGTPLPPGYEAQIRSTLSSLANSPTTPTPVRNAARCVRAPK